MWTRLATAWPTRAITGTRSPETARRASTALGRQRHSHNITYEITASEWTVRQCLRQLITTRTSPTMSTTARLRTLLFQEALAPEHLTQASPDRPPTHRLLLPAETAAIANPNLSRARRVEPSNRLPLGSNLPLCRLKTSMPPQPLALGMANPRTISPGA